VLDQPATARSMPRLTRTGLPPDEIASIPAADDALARSPWPWSCRHRRVVVLMAAFLDQLGAHVSN